MVWEREVLRCIICWGDSIESRRKRTSEKLVDQESKVVRDRQDDNVLDPTWPFLWSSILI